MEIQTQQARSQEVVKIPEGIYTATFVGAKEGKSKTFTDEKTKTTKEVPTVILEFELLDDKGKLVSLFFKGYTPATPTNKLGSALLAIGHKDFSTSFKSEMYVNKTVKVLVEHFKGKDKDGKEEVRSYISKVKPLEEAVN